MNKTALEGWIDVFVPGCLLIVIGLVAFSIVALLVLVAAAIFKL